MITLSEDLRQFVQLPHVAVLFNCMGCCPILTIFNPVIEYSVLLLLPKFLWTSLYSTLQKLCSVICVKVVYACSILYQNICLLGAQQDPGHPLGTSMDISHCLILVEWFSDV